MIAMGKERKPRLSESVGTTGEREVDSVMIMGCYLWLDDAINRVCGGQTHIKIFIPSSAAASQVVLSPCACHPWIMDSQGQRVVDALFSFSGDNRYGAWNLPLLHPVSSIG